MKRRQLFALIPDAAKATIAFLLAFGSGEALAQTVFNFPDSPTANQVVTGPNGQQFQWDGIKWIALGGATPKTGTVSWLAGANPASGTLFYADHPMTITALTGMVEIPNGAAATISVVKANAGVLSAGTVIHSGSFNANGTAGTYQPLTLTVTSLAAGDRLGLTTTGTWTAAVGSISVVVQ